MHQRICALTLCAMLFALCSSARAQQPRKIPLIGDLDYRAANDRDEAFFQALRDLGWIEGQNTSPSSTGGRKGEWTDSPPWQRSWFA
jgi:hypothetical protein